MYITYNFLYKLAKYIILYRYHFMHKYTSLAHILRIFKVIQGTIFCIFFPYSLINVQFMKAYNNYSYSFTTHKNSYYAKKK